MSFSSDVKNEISAVFDSPRHCRLAELGALTALLGSAGNDGNGDVLTVSSENELPVKAFSALVRMIFSIETEVVRKGKMYSADISGPAAGSVLRALKYDEGKKFANIPVLTEKTCCRRSFVRGAFLAAGTVSDPDKSYHFEIVCRHRALAEKIGDMIKALGIDARITERARHYAVYIKDGSQIVDIMGMIGSRKTLMEYENIRIVHEMRGNVNRKVNCETANINKTAEAAAKQMDDILFIRDTIGLSSLPDGLDETARLRLEYPEATLTELGNLSDPPVGKSGANHRLRKLVKIAGELRAKGALNGNKRCNDQF